VFSALQDLGLTDTEGSGYLSSASSGGYQKKSSISSGVHMAVNVEPSLNHWRKLVALWLGHNRIVEVLLTVMSYILFVTLLVLCIVAISGCLSLGSSLTPGAAARWLISVLKAVLLYIFVFEPLKVLIIAVHFAISQNKMLLI